MTRKDYKVNGTCEYAKARNCKEFQTIEDSAVGQGACASKECHTEDGNENCCCEGYKGLHLTANVQIHRRCAALCAASEWNAELAMASASCSCFT